jgi:hypothetical protein
MRRPPATATGAAPNGGRASGWVRTKRRASAVALLLVAALLRPIAENRRRSPTDSFPFSYYPMFSRRRAERARVIYLVGVDAGGRSCLLPHACAGSGGFNQVRRQINRAVREGRADALCASVAASPVLTQTAAFADVVEVRVVAGDFCLTDYVPGNARPLAERVRAAHQVRRDTA